MICFRVDSGHAEYPDFTSLAGLQSLLCESKRLSRLTKIILKALSEFVIIVKSNLLKKGNPHAA
ncbi:MAG: hypothetical protein DRI57_32810 [Deltaproteobacteria bacterium]|nr:MAG: hypothetical protein DRI57_32810 [Deltaproteobacteria bacterium]